MREQTPKRYDLITNYRCGSSIEEMELADDGEWVRWESVEAELSTLSAEQTRLREALIYLESYAEGMSEDAALLTPEAIRHMLKSMVSRVISLAALSTPRQP